MSTELIDIVAEALNSATGGTVRTEASYVLRALNAEHVIVSKALLTDLEEDIDYLHSHATFNNSFTMTAEAVARLRTTRKTLKEALNEP